MASKVIYTLVAATGIALTSGAAWWYQKSRITSNADQALAPQPAGNAGNARANAAAPPVEVSRVEMVSLSDDVRAVGSLRSRRSVVLRPEVSGRITQLNFTDGQRVRKGQVLVQFDDQLPQAQVQQSQAELSIAQANHKRNQDLVAQNFISQRSLDESAASLQVAQAKLALARATAARLKIIAPFDGIVGIRQVNVGDYLKDGSDIVNIEDIDAMYVDFRLPERYQSKVKRGQQTELEIDALPGNAYTAQIQAIDPLIDANGRSIGIRACIDNRALRLRPGMFARVNTVFGVRDQAHVIPEEAIVPQGGRQFVIKLQRNATGQWTSRRVEVKAGLRSPGKVEILEGLQADDTVVRTGQQRLQKDGTVVTVVNLESSAPVDPAAAAAQASQPQAKAAQAPAALPGPNPCGAAVSMVRPSSGEPARSAAAAPSSVASPAAHRSA